MNVMRTCQIADCEEKIHQRGWCVKHYTRWRRNGDPLVSRRPWSKAPLIERLQERIGVEAPGCWLWTGNLLDSGYGMFTYDNKNHMAHRLVWETLIGEIPEGAEMDHLCRVRNCVNPDHLEPVQPRVNVARSANPVILRAATGYCKNGHLRTPENTRIKENVRGRICLDCSALYGRLRRARLRDAC